MRRALRCGGRLTLADVAAEIGASVSSIHYYEKYRRAPRSRTTRERYERLLERLAAQLGLEQL